MFQKQKDLLTEKEKEFNSKLATLDQQLELKAHNLQLREREMEGGFVKLNQQKENFYEEILKICTNKEENTRNVNLNNPSNEHVKANNNNLILEFVEAEEDELKVHNGQTEYTSEESTGRIIARYPDTIRTNEINKHNNKIKTHRPKSKDSNNKENNDLHEKAHHTLEANINRIDTQELIALLKTIQVQNEAMKGFLEDRRRDVSNHRKFL